MRRTVIGCDLSRAVLDLHTLPDGRPRRVENTGAATAAWAEVLARDTLVVLEATGVLARTDRVDARVPAQMGSVLDFPITRPGSPARTRLSDFLRRRRQLVEIRKAGKTRRHNAGQDEIALRIEAMTGLLTRQIAELDRAIARLVEEDRTLSSQARLSSAVPGVGPTVLATLPGELPEPGTLDRRRIASLAGLAPHARESGTWRGARPIWGGRRKVREALTIAALTASRRIPSLVGMRDRRRLKGKAPKTILIAVARQRLVILNAMLRSAKPFTT